MSATVTGVLRREADAVDHELGVAVAERLVDADLRGAVDRRGQGARRRRRRGRAAEQHPGPDPGAEQQRRRGRGARPRQPAAAAAPRPRGPRPGPRRQRSRRTAAAASRAAAAGAKPGSAVCDPEVASLAISANEPAVSLPTWLSSRPSSSSASSPSVPGSAGSRGPCWYSAISAIAESGRYEWPGRRAARTSRALPGSAASVGRSRGTRCRHAAARSASSSGMPLQVGRLGREPDEDVHHGVAPVGRMAGRGEHQRRPEREHVARGRGQGGVPGLLGGHVGGGAGRAAGGGELNPLGHPGHPEVDHLRAVRRHQHVRRLDVAVHQPDAVNRLQRLRAAGREPAHGRHRQRAAPAHQRAQRRRGHVRGGHPGQVRLRVGLDDRGGEHAADPAGGRHLAGEPGPVARLLGQLDPDRLHRDQPPGRGAGEEHLPHRPRAELPDDRVRADPFGVPAAQRLHDRLCQRRLPSLQASLVRHTILHNQLHDGQ